MEEVYINDSMTQSRDARPTTALGLYPDPLPGPSALQVTAGSPYQEQLEGRASLESQVESRSLAPQQIGLRTGGSTEGWDGLYAIPTNLTERQRLMLLTTEDELMRGAVHVIRCKLCPTEELGTWTCFQRHCNTSEDHPAEITFCDRCGDYFGRRDSKKRHEVKKNPGACHKTSRVQAEWKKRTTKRLFDIFTEKLEHCLRTGEELGSRFAEEAQANVPSTSKKPFKDKGIRSRGDS